MEIRGRSFPSHRLTWRAGVVIPLLLAVTGLLAPSPAWGQNGAPESVQQTIERLNNQLQQLESRMKELEAKHTGSGDAPQPPPTENPAPPPPEEHDHTMEIPGGPALHIQGFSDIDYHATNEPGATNTFLLGALDLFVTSKISDKFSMLSEINFEAGDDNEMGVDLERLMLTYAANDHFKLSFGRYHTAIGYYNTAYHHGTWFQTATGRPFLFLFEDEGGVLPVHNVGLSLTGTIPSHHLGLHYIAEIGNGRPARSPQNTTVQNEVDENNGKSFNLGFWLRPEQISGLQFGASIYHDHLIPNVPTRLQENISDIHLVYITNKWELLNEAVLIRHTFDQGGPTFNTPGFYTQISRQWDKYRPYFRYQYINASPAEPLIFDAGLQHGPSFGLRYDWSEFAAFKVQYDHNYRRGLRDLNQLGLQMAFAF